MPDYDLTEKEYRIALRAALVVDAVREALDALTGLAQRLIERGHDQEAANLLAFVLGHPDVRYDTFDYAEDLFLELEGRVCPRVIEDARAFVLGKSLKSVADYALALASSDE